MTYDEQQQAIDLANAGAAEAEADYAANAEMEQENKLALTATFILSLSQFDNMTLAVLNNSVQGLGHVTMGCLAYGPALEANLIKEDGSTWDIEALKDACAYEVNRRVEAGTFN